MSKLFFRSLIVVSGVIGLFTQMYPDKLFKLTYYTTLSNLLVVGFFSWILYLMWTKNEATLNSRLFLRWKGSVTILITLTFLVYAILLAPQADPEDFNTIHNYALHYVVPILVLVDWLIFDKGKIYKWSDPLLWTIAPLSYLAFSLIKGYVLNVPIPDSKHSPYPYFFLNVNQYGWAGVGKYVLMISLAYIVLGLLIVSIKNIQACMSKKNA